MKGPISLGMHWFIFFCVAALFLIGAGLSLRNRVPEPSVAVSSTDHISNSPTDHEKARSAVVADPSPNPVPLLSGTDPAHSNDWLEQILEANSAQRGQEIERKRLLEKVSKEDIHECVRNLAEQPASPLFAPGLAAQQGVGCAVPSRGPVCQWEELKRDPRVAKLLGIVESGTETQKEQLYQELTEIVQTAIVEKGFNTPYANAGTAAPVLMARLEPNVETLGTLCHIWTSTMTVFEEARAQGVTILELRDLPGMVGFAGGYILDRMSEDESLKNNPELQLKLREYQQSKIDDQVELMQWADTGAGQAALQELSPLPSDWYSEPSIYEYAAAVLSFRVTGVSESEYLQNQRQTMIEFARSIVEIDATGETSSP